MFGSTLGSTLVESVCSVELGVESSTLDSSLGEDTTGGSVTLVEGTICSGITMEGEIEVVSGGLPDETISVDDTVLVRICST